MYKFFIIIFIIYQSGFSQSLSKSEVKGLLYTIGKEVNNSNKIINNINSKRIIDNGIESIQILTGFFNDKKESNIFSECLNRKLNINEIAIILADRIIFHSGMFTPYYQLTGVQNCLMTFCDNNPNLIEYYLDYIDEKGIDNFKSDFLEWFRIDKNNFEIHKLSNKEIREILELPYWRIRNVSVDSITDAIYSFEFNRFSNRKGTFIEYIFQNNNRIINSEIKFKILRHDGYYFKIEFKDLNRKWTTKLKYLSKFEIQLDSIKYNYVRME